MFLDLLASCLPAEVEHTLLHFTLQKVRCLLAHLPPVSVGAASTEGQLQGGEEGFCWKHVLIFTRHAETCKAISS